MMKMTKYLIFGVEIIAIILWLSLGASSTFTAVLGVVVIIVLSQSAHHFFHAR
ncbi:hypothetical protein [Lapidilactobacillus bayanensis]|uniref:hypothetical protein n=1 Tax=Lapidilactobacillus bayanensis TaxID=2485998 RepID=UPI0013DD879B|nr:hypothetical protein [Lapidilactobacillus bayanensis]